jgi:heptaprenyl diphosphate synthase
MPEWEISRLPTEEIWAVCDGSRQPVISAVTAHMLATEGKLLRSSVLLEIASLGPNSGSPFVLRAAAVIETLHLASLVHDDVIDDSGFRRGRVTIGPRFGCVAAALAGGWLFARSVEAISICGDTVVELFSDAVVQMCAGEMLEVEDLHNTERSVERYWQAVYGKTAALFALSARLGAELGGLGPLECAAFEEFGNHLGIAFQVADDILDLTADERITGKPAGSDVRHGVYTLPVLYALAESPRLRDRLVHRTSQTGQADLVRAITMTQGVGRALADCRREADAALEAIGDVVGGEDRRRLEQFVQQAVAPAWSGR